MNKKVLIAEDQFIEANDLQLMLRKAGYEVCGIARSVAIAEEMIKKEKPGLVLLDIFLQGKLTGIDLARQLGIGFDEYQKIGIQEPLTITGLKMKDLETVVNSGSLYRLLSDSFRMKIPVIPGHEIPAGLVNSRTKTIHENERDYIITVLKKCNGKIFGIGGAAGLLNVPPTTLISKMKKLGIKKDAGEKNIFE